MVFCSLTIIFSQKIFQIITFHYLCHNTFPYRVYTVGWVNFSEFEIAECGSCKM